MSRREEAFRLFAKGMRPSDQRVKDLGLSPKSTYNYYQQYKRSGGQSPVDMDEIEGLKEMAQMLERIVAVEKKQTAGDEKVQSLAGLLAVILDLERTVSSGTLSCFYNYMMQHYGVSQDEMKEWEPMRKALEANDRLAKLEPIAARLQRMAKKD